jgi:tetratricopeptide (TPR) repeat protein
MTSAKLYIQQKNYDKAMESLKKEVEKNPKSDEGWYYMGVVYGEKEQYGEMMETPLINHSPSVKSLNQYK